MGSGKGEDILRARIVELEYHRRQWRGHALRLWAVLNSISDPDAGPMWMRDEAARALAWPMPAGDDDTDGNGKDGGSNGE